MSVLKKLASDPRILHVDDERSIGNGIILMLKNGYYFYDDCGVMGFDTVQEALLEMKRVKASGRYRVTLPWKFANDHMERELPSGKIVEQKPDRHITLECTLDELKEWRSDASHYCHRDGPDDISIGLRNSARACLKAVEQVMGVRHE